MVRAEGVVVDAAEREVVHHHGDLARARDEPRAGDGDGEVPQQRPAGAGKPTPSATARSFSTSCRRRARGRRGASGVDCCVASGSAVTCSLKTIPGLTRVTELLGDVTVEVGHLADLLVLEHQLRVGLGALHEHVVELPGELDVRHRELDRFPLLAELLHRHRRRSAADWPWRSRPPCGACRRPA